MSGHISLSMVDQVREIVAKIPVEKQLAGMNLDRDIRPYTRGKSGHAGHCGAVGAALRLMGYKRFRKWDTLSGGAFEALWYPPDAGEVRVSLQDIKQTRKAINEIQRLLNERSV